MQNEDSIICLIFKTANRQLSNCHNKAAVTLQYIKCMSAVKVTFAVMFTKRELSVTQLQMADVMFHITSLSSCFSLLFFPARLRISLTSSSMCIFAKDVLHWSAQSRSFSVATNYVYNWLDR